MALTIADAAKSILIEDGRPIISSRDLSGLIKRLYAGEYKSRLEARTRKSDPSEDDIYRAIQRLQAGRVIRKDPDFGAGNYQVYDVLEQTAEAVCCEIDPLFYVSHLAAMQIHGLTDRSPAELVLTRPAAPLWRELLRTRPEPLGEFPTSPRLKKSFPERVRGRKIIVHEIRHPGAWEQSGPRIRVATIGQVFADTLIRPAWCGGMVHVLDIWKRDAVEHYEEIISVMQDYPTKLPKVRAGYILDEVLGIADERVLAWKAFAQRGSSQKLDPEQPYAPTFSESWMLSINA